MRKKLTTTALFSLPQGDFDDILFPGLTLRVGANRKTWTVRHRAGGKQRRDRLGYFPEVGLAEARAAARALAERADTGILPPPAKPHPRSPDILTLGRLLDQYEARRNAEGVRIKRLIQSMRTLRNGLADFLDMPAEKFTKADLRKARDAIEERGAMMQANRLLAYLGPVFRWAAQEDLVPTNFVRDVRRAPERKRKRVLSQAELKSIWEGCERLPVVHVGPSTGAYARLVRFLMLTGQRIDEGASLKHGDLIDGCWRQPENKSDRELSLRLPQTALALVGAGEPHETVFEGKTGKLNGYSKLKTKLDAVSGVTGWRHHDLRRTMMTRMEELDVRTEVVHRVVNHARPGLSGVYLHSTLEKQKAEALQTWADEVARIVQGKTVVPLKTAKLA